MLVPRRSAPAFNRKMLESMSTRVHSNLTEIILRKHNNSRTKSFHIHDLNVDVIRLIRVLAAEVGLTHADIVDVAIRHDKEGR